MKNSGGWNTRWIKRAARIGNCSVQGRARGDGGRSTVGDGWEGRPAPSGHAGVINGAGSRARESTRIRRGGSCARKGSALEVRNPRQWESSMMGQDCDNIRSIAPSSS